MTRIEPVVAPDAPLDALHLCLPDEHAMVRLAGVLAAALTGTEYVALYGPLGAGKTTLARALLRAAGHSGPVRSPTFTLVEPYELRAFTVLHLDLYRLAAAEELEWLGVRDQFGDVVLLIEWPERGEGWLPAADIELRLDFSQATTGADVNDGRSLIARAHSPQGAAVLAQLKQATDGTAPELAG